MFNMMNPNAGPINPFAFQNMLFELKAIHNNSGAVKEGVMNVVVPCTATELQARKTILEMGFEHGWSFQFLKRVDVSIP
jgi:hypothetical protein